MKYTSKSLSDKFGSIRKAATALGVPKSTMLWHLQKYGVLDLDLVANRNKETHSSRFRVTGEGNVEEIYVPRTREQEASRQAAQQGYAPDFDLTHPIPEGMTSRGASIMYDGEGEIRQIWNKSKPAGRHPEEVIKIEGRKKITKVSSLYDQQGNIAQQWVSEKPDDSLSPENIKELISEFLSTQAPISIPKGPAKFDKDVIPWFQIGDAHIGMLAHEAETGANFDLKIAERELCTAFSILFDECQPRERCVINDLGDSTHYCNMLGTTEHSGNILDYDVRFPKMVGVATRVMRFIIDKALEKFKFVDVIINQGNHSRTNDVWLAELLRQVYGKSGRVNVLDNSCVFIPYRMGNTFVMTHHSDKTKPEKLRQVMCQDYRQDWGETEFHYIDVGHLHHKAAIKEDAGCTIEMWNTLAAKDKWHAEAGYRSQQSITRVDRSKTYGEVGRRVLPIKEIHAAIKRNQPDAYVPPERRKVYSV